jgi:hypothetical protein
MEMLHTLNALAGKISPQSGTSGLAGMLGGHTNKSNNNNNNNNSTIHNNNHQNHHHPYHKTSSAIAAAAAITAATKAATAAVTPPIQNAMQVDLKEEIELHHNGHLSPQT